MIDSLPLHLLHFAATLFQMILIPPLPFLSFFLSAFPLPLLLLFQVHCLPLFVQSHFPTLLVLFPFLLELLVYLLVLFPCSVVRCLGRLFILLFPFYCLLLSFSP